MALTQVLSRMDDANMNEHHKTREMIEERVRKRKDSLTKDAESTRKMMDINQQPLYDQDLVERRNQFWLDFEESRKNVGKKNDDETNSKEGISGMPDAIDVSFKDEQRARSLVHSTILDSLRYSTMRTRYEEVFEAYPKTFDWLFNESTTPELTAEQPWSSFVDWLRDGSGVYWVNGKAASGKSTFMRYIYDSSQTREYLKNWAKDIPLCIATFFFWNSGSSEQKSQSGLLRALLYQVLENCPQLTPIVFPSLWARIYSQTVRCLEVEEEMWSIPKLTQAFDTLIKQKAVALNLFFLIDGLDEFESNRDNHHEMDYEEICALFKDISSFKNIKVCLSSRPWVVFQDNFHDSPSLKLQDLTSGDIQHYTTSKFCKSNAFRRLARENPEAAKDLISDVVNKSDGVFLWVRVVVRDLLDGLVNYDGLQDLEKRLNSLPRDLEALYEHMLKRTDPNHKGPASEIFQIFWTCQHHRDIVGPADSNESTQFLTILGLYLAMNGDKLGVEGVMSMSETDLTLRCKETGIQMTARCAGLLELSQRKGSNVWDNLNKRTRYMHRTAKDFMERADKWKSVLSQTDETNFNPYESLMKSCILQLGLIPIEILKKMHDGHFADHSRWVQRTATSAMIYAYFSDLKTHKPNTQWLDRLDIMMTKFHQLQKSDQKRKDWHWSNLGLFRFYIVGGLSRGSDMRNMTFADFVSYAVQFGLTEYVGEKLRQFGKRNGPHEGVSLLQYAVRCAPPVLRYPRCSKMVLLLLRHGEDPNERFQGYSPWEEVLKSIRRGEVLSTTVDEGFRREQQLEYINIIGYLIEAGANPQAYVKDGETNHTAMSLLCTVRSNFPEAARLEETLRRRGGKETVSHRQRLKRWWGSVERNTQA